MGDTLYVTDLDGTLLKSDQTMSEFSIETINALIEAGMQFSIATARSYTSAYSLIQKLKLNLPMATYNGAFLVKPDGSILSKKLLDTFSLNRLAVKLKLGRTYPLVYSIIDGRERIVWLKGKESSGVKQYLAERENDPRLYPVERFQELFQGEVFYLTIIGTQAEIKKIQTLAARLPMVAYNIQEDTYHPGEYWYEIFSVEATKANAVRELRRTCSADEVVCFGDNLNDMPMFQASNRAYAVANANKVLQKHATGMIASNEDDGVADFLARELIEEYEA